MPRPGDPEVNARRIIDAHHHLWDLQAVHYPWLMATGQRRFFGDPGPIQRNYRVDDFEADIGTLPVVDSVHIQVGASDALAETRWVQGHAGQTGLPGAMVAFCDLAAPDAAATLDAHLACDRVRGIRQIVGRSRLEGDGPEGNRLEGNRPQTDLLDNPAWRAGLERLVERGLSFDLQLIPSQLARAHEVLAAVPALNVALCHAGSPGDAGAAGFEDWRRGIRALAALPNVWCKLSGFAMFDHAWTVESIRPYVMACIAAFGPERCMFGSNFPVDRLYSGYRETWAAYLKLIADFSDHERDRMLYANARAFYKPGNSA